MSLKSALIHSPLGELLAVADSGSIVLLEFADRTNIARQVVNLKLLARDTVEDGVTDLHDQLKFELAQFFARKKQAFSVPVKTYGTEFQRSVWHRVRQLPYGSTTTYSLIASELGRVGASRAVGTANGANKLAILIPCHRVIGHSGDLCGYAGGLWRKKALLSLEANRERCT